MTHVTTQLGDESGIQYQGVDDKTNINQIGNMSNMLMLVENIPRGRLDKEMTITKANMKALLGQEKGNLYLQAVDDALDTKVQSIKVLRVLSSDSEQPNVVISCEGATDLFIATTDHRLRTIEVSVNDAPWVDIYSAQELSVQYNPISVGASLRISLAEHITVARVKMRSSLEVGLYVNSSQSINEIEQSNQTYTLFDEHHNVIDPHLASNHVYARDFDDTSTDEDYAVYFREVNFCLKKIQPQISCDGATTSMSFSQIAGDFDIFIDDMEVPAISESIGPAMYQLGLLYPGKLEGSYDGFLYMSNTDNVPHRLKFVPKQNSNASFTANEGNPTFLEHDDGGFTFCLAPMNQDLYTPAVQALNPVAYYLMDEAEGSTINDSSNSNFDGDIQNYGLVDYRGDVLRKGSKGALGFNLSSGAGTAQCYVSDTVAGDTFMKLAGNEKSCTIAFWCKPISSKQYNWLVAYVLNSTMGYNNYRLISYGDSALLAHSPESENQTYYDTFSSMVGQSNFIVWRKDASEGTYSLTVNGVKNTVAGESSPEQIGEGFFFPMSNGYSSFGLRGYMSDMSVFDYALTDAQIDDLFQKGRVV